MNFKRNSKNTKLFLFLGICLILIGICIYSQISSTTLSVVEGLITPIPPISLIPLNSPTPLTSFAKVTKVFDGDTIEIESGEKIRYIGIDAAEIYPTPQCFSNESLAKNKELVLGKAVRLEKDVSETDKYGRLLRFVYIGDIFVNNELTKEGYTKVMTVPPDIKYMDQFTQSEKYAKGNNLGLWSKCF